MIDNQTVIALSSGSLPCGVAVIRISGAKCAEIARLLIGMLPTPRQASLRAISNPDTGELYDKGLILWFPGPDSFTGEDCLEFQVHGGTAVVSAIVDVLCSVEDVRLAEPGEFTRRAFENGKMDLTEIDGLADLLASQTAAQRQLALNNSQGALRAKYDAWRGRLIHIRAMIEAEFDFSDEEDVPDEISREGLEQLASLKQEIIRHLDDGRAGEIIRDGFSVALMGKPNAGKSSLLNALAKRDIAIVTEHAGTTRDVLDVELDIDGHKAIISDTAGIRDAAEEVEAEGIRRANRRADESDLVVWLSEAGGSAVVDYKGDTEVLSVVSKVDEIAGIRGEISSKTGNGLDWLLDEISARIKNATGSAETGLITRRRYREGLNNALAHIETASAEFSGNLEFRAEELRLAGDCIGRITGKIDVEDLLDVIFSEFCVGK